MTTKEIQIGNWLTDGPNGFPMFVQAIYGDDTVYLDFDGNEGDTWETDIKDICPIPITEELLLKNGFEMNCTKSILTYKEKINGWSIDLSSIYNKKAWYLRCYRNTQPIPYVMVEYIHEIQNAVRLITKQDLKIEI